MRQAYEGAIKEFKRSIGLAHNFTYVPDATQYRVNAYLSLDDTKGRLKLF